MTTARRSCFTDRSTSEFIAEPITCVDQGGQENLTEQTAAKVSHRAKGEPCVSLNGQLACGGRRRFSVTE